MLPLGDLTRPARFPWMTVGLTAVNVLVWVAYELPAGVDDAVGHLGFRPCEVDGSCSGTSLPWPVESLTAMFTHGGWSHIVGNLVFLLAFGPLVESMLGRRRFLLLYLVAGFAADALQGWLTLTFTPGDADVPTIGASGAISGVIGAYLVVRPFERILTWVMPALFFRIPAIGLLGVWFLLQALEGTYTLSFPGSQVGIAFFAHVGGFVAGVLLATAFLPGAWTRRALGSTRFG